MRLSILLSGLLALSACLHPSSSVPAQTGRTDAAGQDTESSRQPATGQQRQQNPSGQTPGRAPDRPQSGTDPMPAQPQTPEPPAVVPTVPAAPSPFAVESPLTPFAALQGPPRPFLSRLTRAPDMFGDSIATQSLQMTVRGNTGPIADAVRLDLPTPGGLARFKNEHARALPSDRIFVLYNHFHNALDFQVVPNSPRSRNVNLVTPGFEHTFDDGRSSVELRLPLASVSSLNSFGVGYDVETIGNLVVSLKTLLSSTEDHAVAMGLAVTVPTASDLDIDLAGDELEIRNEAVHLLPYFAVQLTPDDNWFFHLFGQFDSAASSNEFVFRSGGATSSAKVREQSLFYVDASAGYWWHRADDAVTEGLTGVASVVELHWTTTAQEGTDTAAGSLSLTSLNDHIDVLNATVGLHAEWNRRTSLRVAGVLPLRRSRDNRFFDAEVQASLIHRY